MTNREAFNRNLKRLMESNGKKQIDLATYLSTSPTTISSWINGITYPNANNMNRIAQFFNVSLFELVCENDNDEEKLLNAFRLLSPIGKEKALERMEELKKLYWYDL